MPGLLDLPSELLLDIISLVLSSPIPISPHARRGRPSDWHMGHICWYPDPESTILYAPNALGLLLTNRRLHAAMTYALSSHPQAFKVNMAVMDAYWLWPTWTYIPTRRTPHILSRFEIQLTPCCTPENRYFQVQWPMNNSGSCSDALWRFIERFLSIGPWPKGKEDAPNSVHSDVSPPNLECPANLRVKTLVINIDATQHVTGNETLSEERVPARYAQDLAHRDFSVLYPIDRQNSIKFMDLLAKNMDDMVKMTYWAPSFSIPFLERVGVVQFCVDGSLYKEVNIAGFVNSVHPGQYDIKSVNFWAKKVEKRRQLGV